MTKNSNGKNGLSQHNNQYNKRSTIKRRPTSDNLRVDSDRSLKSESEQHKDPYKNFVRPSILQMANHNHVLFSQKKCQSKSHVRDDQLSNDWVSTIKENAYTKEEMHRGDPEKLLNEFDILPCSHI